MEEKMRIFGKDITDSEPQEFLSEFNLKLEKSFEISSTRGEHSSESELSIREDHLLQFQFDDDTVWFGDQVDMQDLFKDQKRSADGTFELPGSISIPTNNRGAFKKVFLKAFKVFERTKEIPADVALGLAGKIESQVLSEGLNIMAPDFALRKFEETKASKTDVSQPILLFIHGTGSSTMGSFGGLLESEAWKSLCRQYPNNILAYEYRTWTLSPLQNTFDLLKSLPENAKLHVISHSRGGIIGDFLSRCNEEQTYFQENEINYFAEIDRKEDAKVMRELNSLAAKKNIKVEKFVRVACPAGGTTILSKRLDHFLNFLMNVVGYSTGWKGNPIFLGIKSLLGAIVDQRNEPGVLPGLEAMIPDSPIQELLNNHLVSIDHELSIIAGNAGSGSVKKTLLFLMSRLYYQTDNDFVVDTDSMFVGAQREGKVFYHFVSGKEVDHFSYFSDGGVQQKIVLALFEEFGAAKGFKEVRRTEKNRALLHGGALMPEKIAGERPLVVFLPGIMGSNLSENISKDEAVEKYEEIWIEYMRMARGGIMRMTVDNEKIKARSIVGTVYSEFVKYLKGEYEVLVFPFDWRLSVSVAGEDLAARIESFLEKGQSIQIVAHSMGGLVVRDIIMNHKGTWNKLKADHDFRCILLGTPWLGSYLIPEVITGYSRRIRTIARLALFQKKKTLLKIFVKYPGLLELLPIDDQSHPFEDIELWKSLTKATDESTWELPSEEDLKKFSNYKKKVNNYSFDNLDRIIYVAGKADKTVSNFVFKNRKKDQVDEKIVAKISSKLDAGNYQLVFTGTDQGDGSVTWATGIPEGVEEENIYFMDTGHMDMANDKKHYRALLDLIKNGTTNRLSRKRPASRSAQQQFEMLSRDIISNDPEALLRETLGIQPIPAFAQFETTTTLKPVKVRMMNGHLKYARNPLIVGHFKNDGIVSAEHVVNHLMDYKLSERLELGSYPGDIGTNKVLLSHDNTFQGAVVVGLGEPENLTPFLLSQTIEKGCLEYLLTKRDREESEENEELGISTLLVGTNYGYLSLSNSILAILDGIMNTNIKVQRLGLSLPQITEIEFIELYEFKSLNAYSALNEIVENEQVSNIELIPKIQKKSGGRSLMPVYRQRGWWKRITSLVKEENGSRYLYFSASTGRARVEARDLFTNHRILDGLLKENSMDNNWDRELTKTIFELLIPNDLKLSFRNRQNLLLILDKTTAGYPWELLHYDSKAGDPICTSAGMIRQLATYNDRRSISPVNNNKALIIGDPILDSKHIAQLPEAEQEAIEVNELLQKNNFVTTACIHKPYNEIVKKIYEDYRIIHVSSHGVIDFGPEKKTGILLSDDIVLSAAEVNQITTTPELVFINSCHMGAVDADKEVHFRDKSKLAANIGTQLIENGVKAVIVAGWAVNDAAARRFAQVFYREMLGGEIFAEAVKEARKVCYQEFQYTNTWGAYQCYGDPYYKLERRGSQNKEEEPYILEKEILIDLEIFVNDAKSSRTRKWTNKKKLDKISRRIDESGLRNSEITQQEALAYAEIREYELALDKFKPLLSADVANYSVRALEEWSNLRARYLTDLKGKVAGEVLIKSMQEVIQRLEGLSESYGRIYSRCNCLASIWKKMSTLQDEPGEKKVSIKKMTEYYKEAYELGKKTNNRTSFYPLTNWIIGEKLLGNRTRLAAAGKALPPGIAPFITARKEEAILTNDNKEFWDLIKIINYNQCLQFFENKEGVKALEAQILDDYKEAWKLAGSEKNKDSEISQMEFIKDSLIAFGKENSVLCRSTIRMLKFFETL